MRYPRRCEVGLRRALRPFLNRILVSVALVIGLPLVAIAERLRRGWGRVAARRMVLAATRACGVSFAVRVTEEVADSHGYVCVANHSSPLDIPAMLVARPDIRFLAAADLFGNPLLAIAMRALETVPVDRRDGAAARRQLAKLAADGGDLRLAVFAEGRIAPAERRLPFKWGAFALAIGTGASVVPVAIHNTGDLLPPGGRLALRPGRVTVEFLAPIPTTGLGRADREYLRHQTEEAVTAALKNGPPLCVKRAW